MKSEKRTEEPKEKRTEEPQNIECPTAEGKRSIRIGRGGKRIFRGYSPSEMMAVLEAEKHSEGRKDDEGKARFDLLPPDALWEVVRVYTFGAGKYGDRNWEKGIRWGRVFAAICRHLFAWWLGERHDPETGLSHLAHAAWGCKTLLAYELRGMTEFDERKTWQK